ncbi:hypothetical protein OCS65_28290 (plasmid) [Rhodococcus aetherivorans]|uniref:Uncharacterized protein n=1 Tax=Rhodococcus aetherivorans TaxID=191292 RepID=A0AA46P260_9NOCA|nr:hypothetical protein [Rhodococcus aetherivorans]UYF97126.1 hypothetical protein OCS65_28290 [Rhodococcus aetherivorans]
MNGLLGVGLVVVIVCAAIAATIAGKKNRDALGFGILGLLFGPIGVLVAAVVAPGRPSAPEGFVAVTCPRCNTDQNVTKDEPKFECYQCQTESRVLDAGGDIVVKR